MDITSFEEDNRKSCVVKSDVPSVAMKVPCQLGIDEAGRGPVLGPMVYGACYCPVSYKDDLKASGVADSKTLSEEDRELLFEKINSNSDNVGWIIHILSPNEISNCMLSREKFNLNSLSHQTAIGLIQNALDMGVNLEEVYVDTVGDPAKYQEKLASIFPGLLISVAKKADSLYPVVSAASICAKVARDKAVKGWTFQERINLPEDVRTGSGYPADPDTKKFMTTCVDKVFGYTNFVRFSWSTADVLIKKHCVDVGWEDDEDENATRSKKRKQLSDAAKGTPSIQSFFHAAAPRPAAHTERHVFFTERHLKTINEL